jgi:cytoskeletal protein RodZ
MDVEFGRDLRKERESRGVALEAIAAGTKVSLRHLRALEDENHGALPGGVFNKGIIRSYCRYVGLEEREWLERFASGNPAETSEPDWASFAESVQRGRLASVQPEERRWWGVLMMVVGLAALSWFAWHAAIAPRVHGQERPATSAMRMQSR